MRSLRAYLFIAVLSLASIGVAGGALLTAQSTLNTAACQRTAMEQYRKAELDGIDCYAEQMVALTEVFIEEQVRALDNTDEATIRRLLREAHDKHDAAWTVTTDWYDELKGRIAFHFSMSTTGCDRGEEPEPLNVANLCPATSGDASAVTTIQTRTLLSGHFRSAHLTY